ncbi:MAG: hypothetical protein WBG46_05710 [Nonlabens sp.]
MSEIINISPNSTKPQMLHQYDGSFLIGKFHWNKDEVVGINFTGSGDFTSILGMEEIVLSSTKERFLLIVCSGSDVFDSIEVAPTKPLSFDVGCRVVTIIVDYNELKKTLPQAISAFETDLEQPLVPRRKGNILHRPTLI